ncbi:MAG: hypothetical protein ACLPX9_04420, partial [Rhodomicrobium sp.]
IWVCGYLKNAAPTVNKEEYLRRNTGAAGSKASASRAAQIEGGVLQCSPGRRRFDVFPKPPAGFLRRQSRAGECEKMSAPPAVMAGLDPAIH